MSLAYLTNSKIITASEQFRSELVPIPVDADDVCPVCRSWRDASWQRCSNCLEAQSVLSRPCDRVIPITLYRKPSKIRDWLTYYKEGAEQLRREYVDILAIIIDRFLIDNCLHLFTVVSGYDIVTTVPSSQRLGVHPFRQLLSRDELVFGARLVDVLKRGPGVLGRRILSDDAFVPVRPLDGVRVLVIDDVYTTGSRAQSAASAINLGGGTVVGILVVARRVDPDFNQVVNALWSRQRGCLYSYPSALEWLLNRP